MGRAHWRVHALRRFEDLQTEFVGMSNRPNENATKHDGPSETCRLLVQPDEALVAHPEPNGACNLIEPDQ